MLHRFLMPDNFLQDPYSTLSYNRYSYVLNNPLMYTDANGEFFWFAVIAGAVIGAVAQAVKPGANFGTIVGGGLIGAVAGMVGFSAVGCRHPWAFGAVPPQVPQGALLAVLLEVRARPG